MSKSSRLFEKAKKVIPGGVNSPVRAFAPYPFFTSSGKGSRIRDVDGNEYIDYCLAYGPLILGHACPEVVEAVGAQLAEGTLYGTPTEQEVELAELIHACVPSAEMVRLTTTGAEATMAALRTARAFTGKNKAVKFEGCYHGAHDGVLVKAGSGATTFGVPDSLGVPEEATRNTLVCPFNDAEKLEKVIKKERADLAAIIMEPVIGNIGVVLPKEGYLRRVRELTEDYGVVLIFDEVITGFRLALGGAQEYFDVTPDMTTLGKILGGGFPIAAFTGQKEIMQNIAPAGKAYQAGTYSGNPISVTAALATLKTIKRRGKRFYERLEAKCESMTKGLKKLAEDNGIAARVNGVASMFQIFFTGRPVSDYETAKTSDAKRFMMYHAKLLKSGVFVPPSQYETCFISSEHSDKDVKETISVAERVLSDLRHS
jgi:glutamate-1-semialdehyde 2,1-aminomutase